MFSLRGFVGASVAMAALLGCEPMGTPELEITARPSDIADIGEETTIQVTTRDAKGGVGKGKIKLTSIAGTFKGGAEFELDAYGVVRAQFSCPVKDDSLCIDTVRIAASWVVGKDTITGDVRVRITPPPPPPWEASVVWDSAASPVSCSGVGQPAGTPCSNGTCAHGFSCVNDVCILNGGGGGLQYTLRFGQSVDLDLHVVEPVSAMLSPDEKCEIYYGDPNTSGRNSSCGATAALDLDSNAGCRLDNVNIENIIFPNTSSRPPPGTYVARVDLWAACMSMTPISWELEVRAGRMKRFYCGTFQPSEADSGGRGSGRTISTIIVPPP